MKIEVLAAKKAYGSNYLVLCHILDNPITPWAIWLCADPSAATKVGSGTYFYGNQESLAHASFDSRSV